MPAAEIHRRRVAGPVHWSLPGIWFSRAPGPHASPLLSILVQDQTGHLSPAVALEREARVHDAVEEAVLRLRIDPVAVLTCSLGKEPIPFPRHRDGELPGEPVFAGVVL